MENPMSNQVGGDHYTSEEWRAVVGFENYYEVSNLGSVRSVIRRITRITKGGSYQTRPYGGKVLSPKVQDKGHLEVSLWKKNKGKTKSVHRLVLESFLGPQPHLVCNHIDGNPGNNKLENLEWCTQKENLHHSANVLGRKMVWQLNKERAAHGSA